MGEWSNEIAVERIRRERMRELLAVNTIQGSPARTLFSRVLIPPVSPTARRQAPLILEDIAALSAEQQPACSRGVGKAGETGDICT